MATFTTAMSNNLMEQLLPAYGQPRKRMPIWDEGQRMFLFDQHESTAGHLYYKGVRFGENVAIVEYVSQYYNCTYLNSLELYAYSGNRVELVQKRIYEKTFRNEAFIRSEAEGMVKDYLRGMAKIQKCVIPEEYLETNVRNMVENCSKSFLDRDYALPMQLIARQLEGK